MENPRARPGKYRTWLPIAVACLLVVAIGGRIYARMNALNFGRKIAQGYMVLGKGEFANTAGLRTYFSEPDMVGYVTWVERLSFLGGGESERIRDLKAGLIYYSEQASLPTAQRFLSPPALKHLRIDISDRTDSGLEEAASNLILSYESQLGVTLNQ
jgi:hypothetical protein